VETSRRDLVTKTKCTGFRKIHCLHWILALSSSYIKIYYSHAATPSLQVRTDADRPPAARHALSGGHLNAVPPKNTSQTCLACGHVSAENRQTQARFACVECRFEEHADQVSAINLLRAGHARCPCDVSGAVMPPAAGTHRSDASLLDARVSAVGIPRR